MANDSYDEYLAALRKQAPTPTGTALDLRAKLFGTGPRVPLPTPDPRPKTPYGKGADASGALPLPQMAMVALPPETTAPIPGYAEGTSDVRPMSERWFGAVRDGVRGVSADLESGKIARGLGGMARLIPATLGLIPGAGVAKAVETIAPPVQNFWQGLANTRPAPAVAAPVVPVAQAPAAPQAKAPVAAPVAAPAAAPVAAPARLGGFEGLTLGQAQQFARLLAAAPTPQAVAGRALVGLGEKQFADSLDRARNQNELEAARAAYKHYMDQIAFPKVGELGGLQSLAGGGIR